MGRNNDTFTLVIERNKETWSKYRRALRKEDQLLFDEMWRAPKLHLAAGAFIANEIPLESIFMSMLLEQYKKIKQLENGLQIADCGLEIRNLEPSNGAEEQRCRGEVAGDR